MDHPEEEKKNTNVGESPAEKLRRILSSSKKEESDVEGAFDSIQEPLEQAKNAADEAEDLMAQGEPPAGAEEIQSEVQAGDTTRIPTTEREKTQSLAESIAEFFGDFINIFQRALDGIWGIFRGKKLNPDESRENHTNLPISVREQKKSGFLSRFKGKPLNCLLTGILGAFFTLIVIAILGLSFIIFQYFTIAAGLPSVNDLRQYASQFETTSIYDRNGNLIYEILDPNAGRRTYITLEEISPYLIAATIATEDKDFYTNPGFDPWGIIRAFWQNYTSGEVVSGASTITQQLARTLLLSPEERSQVTTQRKAREIVLAAEITRKYSKDEILELYLNEIYYGNLAYGIEAAAETYFNISAGQLNLAQASFLAGLPQAPAIYDVFTYREAALLRHADVLNLMYQLSLKRNCIPVRQSNVPICVTLEEAVAAAQEIEQYNFVQRAINMPYPHWVHFIRTQLEAQFDPQTIYRSGFKVYTTLDPDLQNYAQTKLKEQVDSLVENDATNGALVAIRPQSGEILAMVGSADFSNEAISGQVNMAVAPRQPGSSIKPLTYIAAFEKGWTPATLIWDVPSEFPPSGNPDDPREPYKPVNYDGKFHGPVLARTALGSSYNVPAVKTLAYVGIYDDPETPQKEGFIAFAERLGITTLTRDDYGLSLTLGGGDVSLLELTGAFSIFANSGVRIQPYSIEKIIDHSGNVVFQRELKEGEKVISSEHAYLISNILSDNAARTPAFGGNSVLKLPFSAAVKTGTTNDFRDNWTLGYTPDIVIGVWIGNADYTPMKNISGVTGAAPLWADIMQWAINRYNQGDPTPFSRPAKIEEHVICSISGTEPSELCPNQTREIFAQGQPPLEKKDDLWKEVEVDTWTNLKASSACSEFSESKLVLNVSEKWAVKWIKENNIGQEWAKDKGFPEPVVFVPERECRGDDPRPTIVFVGMQDDMNVTTPILDIYTVVSATKHFEQFKLQYGIGNNPSKWTTLLTSKEQFTKPEKLISWDVYQAGASRVTLRIYLKSSQDTFAEKRIHVNLLVPTLTPTNEISPTETPTPTQEPSPTETATPEVVFPTVEATP